LFVIFNSGENSLIGLAGTTATAIFWKMTSLLSNWLLSFSVLLVNDPPSNPNETTPDPNGPDNIYDRILRSLGKNKVTRVPSEVEAAENKCDAAHAAGKSDRNWLLGELRRSSNRNGNSKDSFETEGGLSTGSGDLINPKTATADRIVAL